MSRIIATRLRTLAAGALNQLDQLGLWFGLLSLRVLVAWEFFEAGREKWRGENWFADIADRFPFPFNVVPPELSWQLATAFELLGGIALVIGLGTRFFSVSLIVLTIVAIASVHWPEGGLAFGDLLQGYVLTDQGQGNFKLPVIYIAMLLPLVLMGPGKLSLDAWLRRRFSREA